MPSRRGSGEELIGQIPCKWVTDHTAIFGGWQTRQGNLLITSLRILFLHETDESNTDEMAEDERVEEEVNRLGITLREYVRDYDWLSGPGQRFRSKPLAALLEENSRNWELSLERILGAEFCLEDEDSPDLVRIDVAGESQPRRVHPYRASGEVLLRWMRSLLGSGRVTTTNQSPAER